MKKTLAIISLCCLTTLLSAHAATIDTYDSAKWTWNDTTGTLNLTNPLTGSEDWTLTAYIYMNGTSGNQWGSSLLASGTNPTENSYDMKNFQFYMKNSGGMVGKGMITGNTSSDTTVVSTSFNSGYIKLTMNWATETRTLSWDMKTSTSDQTDLTTDFSSLTWADYANKEMTNLTDFASSGNITNLSAMLNRTEGNPSEIRSLTISIGAVPEPATATLSLLGFAGLLLRRRVSR